MPIRESQKPLYPPNWKEISARIRFMRARSRCECTGECGDEHCTTHQNEPGRCNAVHGSLIVRSFDDPWRWWAVPYNRKMADMLPEAYHLIQDGAKVIKVVLTCAHLNHNPGDNRDSNLLAMCQRCHLKYDAEVHQHNARKTRAARQGKLFDTEEMEP